MFSSGCLAPYPPPRPLIGRLYLASTIYNSLSPFAREYLLGPHVLVQLSCPYPPPRSLIGRLYFFYNLQINFLPSHGISPISCCCYPFFLIPCSILIISFALSLLPDGRHSHSLSLGQRLTPLADKLVSTSNSSPSPSRCCCLCCCSDCWLCCLSRVLLHAKVGAHGAGP
jgi:hypothetical protein